MLEELETKFGKDELNTSLQVYGTAENLEKLTESQARYLLRSFDSIDALRNYFATAGNEAVQSANQGTLRQRQEEPTRQTMQTIQKRKRKKR
jgi:hypothetical protein